MTFRIKYVASILLFFCAFAISAAYFGFVAAYSHNSWLEVIWFLTLWGILIFHPIVIHRRYGFIAILCGVVIALPIGSILHLDHAISYSEFVDWHSYPLFICFILVMWIANRAVGYISRADEHQDAIRNT